MALVKRAMVGVLADRHSSIFDRLHVLKVLVAPVLIMMWLSWELYLLCSMRAS